MKKGLLIVVAAMPLALYAQKNMEKKEEVERIIITKKGPEAEKMNIVVDGEKVTVNGKPLDDSPDGDITVRRLKIKDPQTFNWSPETGFDNDEYNATAQVGGIIRGPNKAMLGIITEKTEEGVKVMRVNDGTGAQKAGLKEGDIITEVEGKIIESPDQLSESLKEKKPGDKVSIGYKREGKVATANAELTKWDAPQVMTFGGNNAMAFSNPNVDFEELMSRAPRSMDGNSRNGNIHFFDAGPLSNGPKLGIKVQDVAQGSGAKVIELEKGSDADKAGLKEGDIIKEANGKEVLDVNTLLSETRKSKFGSTLNLKVSRSGQLQSIEVPFSKKIKTADL